MNQRQEQLLILVIENYIKTAEPIGSKFLTENTDLGVSGATLRNEMRFLEEEGYLTHPHTSAGRMPTEKGYRFYLENVDFGDIKMSKKEIAEIEQKLNRNFVNIKNDEQVQKDLAKIFAELTGETVLVAFSPDRVYYTGLSNLFSKPEFSELEMVTSVSQIFDHCEDCLKDFFDKVDSEVKYFVGEEHSFGNALSVLAFRFGAESLFSVLSPMRTNYKKNFVLAKKIQEIISK